MKKLIVPIATTLSLACIAVMFIHFYKRPSVQNVFPPKYYTEDMPPAEKNCKVIQIMFADSVDGRATYTVMFPDSTVIESMYPEEIANGLVTGKWDYNEMFTITERY